MWERLQDVFALVVQSGSADLDKSHIISTGIYGYPVELAAGIAVTTVRKSVKDAPAIREVVSEGAGNVRLANLMQADIIIVATGSGKITAHGNVRCVDIAVSSGDVDASGVVAEVGKLSVCGSGEIAAFIRQSLTARISGAGDIVIGGNPNQRNTRIEGSGDVRFR